MKYTIKQLATLASVSVRTLHYYDEIGLLSPLRENNTYRVYGEKDLLKLQQILFFRELDFPVAEIKSIMSNPRFDMNLALLDQKKLIQIKKHRLEKLVATINKTMKKINNEKNMQNKMRDEELYNGLSKEEAENYAREAKARWGNTKAYKESQEKVAKMTKEDMAKYKKEADLLMKEIVKNMKSGPKSPEVQALIQKHYNALGTFYTPTLEIYKGLAEMYVADPRFTAYYEKYAKGLAQFMKDAMLTFCEAKK